MRTNRRRRHDNDREARVRELKQRAKSAAAREMIAWESEILSGEQREQFWGYVVEFETAPSTTNFRQLTDAGVKLPEPEAMDDKALIVKLWEVIGALARIRVFISQTNHLSDRQLYAHLYAHVLREEVEVLADDSAGAWHVDLLGGGSEEDTQLFLKYYASVEWRKDWAARFPDTVAPAHEDPPYYRDRHLPKPNRSQRL